MEEKISKETYIIKKLSKKNRRTGRKNSRIGVSYSSYAARQ